MIGVFDSGVGGLSVLGELLKVLPEEGYVYYCDNAHCPYGGKPQSYIIERARLISAELMSLGCRMIVVGCNTATAAAIATLREENPNFPFIGMEPAIKPAATLTRSGVIGALATAGTLSSEKFLHAVEKLPSNVKVLSHVGEGFVELVESGNVSGPEAEATVRRSLQPLLDGGADVIVLGCTHYPFLYDTIKSVAGPGVRVIDPAPAVARHASDLYHASGPSDGKLTIKLLASGDDSLLQKMTFDIVSKGILSSMQ